MSAITLDQLRVFVSIADLGSFAAAARHLNRTQSAITYTIQKLEEQTNLELFDRKNYRASLTKAGQSLLPHAQKVISNVSSYQNHAEGIARGLEASITLAVSQFADDTALIDTLLEFSATFPTVRVSISTITTQSTEILDDESVDLALLPEFIPFGAPYRRASLGQVKMCAVANPDHPLSRFKGKITVDAMQSHTQIITSARNTSKFHRTYAVQSLNFWQANDLKTKLTLILKGVGWGGMPEHMVSEHLSDGSLVLLDPESWDGLDQMPTLNIVVAHKQYAPLGPAASWLFEKLKTKI